MQLPVSMNQKQDDKVGRRWKEETIEVPWSVTQLVGPDDWFKYELGFSLTTISQIFGEQSACKNAPDKDV